MAKKTDNPMEKAESMNDGSTKGLGKTVIATIGTIVTAAGAWAVSFFGSGKKEEKAQPQINISVPAQQQPVTKTVVVKEKAEKKEEKKPEKKKEEAPW